MFNYHSDCALRCLARRSFYTLKRRTSRSGFQCVAWPGYAISSLTPQRKTVHRIRCCGMGRGHVAVRELRREDPAWYVELDDVFVQGRLYFAATGMAIADGFCTGLGKVGWS